MKRGFSFPTFLLLLLVMSAFTRLPAAYAASTHAIDEQARAALASLYQSSPAAKALGEGAKAVLVFPDIHKAAFVIGAQYGDGVLFRDRKVSGHYRVNGVLAGLEAGAESHAHALFFMSDAALAKLRSAKGWEVGADPNIVVADGGAAKELTTRTLQGDVYSFVFNQQGLMGGVALQGLRIMRTRA